MYFYALPTLKQMRRVAWLKLKKLVPPEWIRSINETDKVIETVFGSSLYGVGMDKPQRIEGDQWDGGVLDESCDMRPKSFELSIRPALSHRNGWCWRIGVPKRYGIGAADFKKFFERGVNGDPEIAAFHWPSEDILTQEECEAARRILDPRDYNEQYRASWEQVGGLLFYAFDEVLNTQAVAYDPSAPLIVGTDFNVDPMAWVIGHDKGGAFHVFDELFLRNTNTRKSLDALFAKYGEHSNGFHFYGDASGAARKTSASKSDYVQIRNDKRFQGGRVYFPKSNPRIKDRFAACNALFLNAADERRCLIHPRCKHLIEDLTTRAYKEGTNEPDDYNDIGHISDALGYVIHRKWPLRVKSGDYVPKIMIAGG
jgi:hypothetical protein